MKKLIVFDLDGTLAESKAAIDPEMSTLLYSLLQVARVAIISGGAWPQFQKQVLAHLPDDERLQRLSILPTCGTQFYEYNRGWNKRYSEDFSADEKAKIIGALQAVVATLGYQPAQHWGDTIEDRGSQITFSALGQKAPLEEKKKWDPDFSKRQQMKTLLEKMIPEFSINLGGTTSVDITKPGIDKAYGIHKLRDILIIGLTEMLFVGDAIFPGGNDYPAREAGVDCIKVRDPDETKRVIETVVVCYAVL
ncbi:HAD-IIB family hydrolase [Chitinophaga polysaccharea]|uniref:HAD-IIB family hydrolase n=1 Tax=Chitinophaga TaxID=79328 RepID=UPI001455B29D|nr:MULTISPECIES: HAD-IIB family hydrolase [Chitinophaga]NLR58102.1 HAD-IIB family hydrolase [Chitinophaga polysaccharea]NLU93695.1 HAD-IIB family hydrolase [Chitinophaga sp. Ak27]